MTDKVNGADNSVQYAAMATDWDDEYARQLAELMNWQSEVIVKTHAMVLEMWGVFNQLKPLVESMPLGMLGGMGGSGGPVLPPGFPRGR